MVFRARLPATWPTPQRQHNGTLDIRYRLRPWRHRALERACQPDRPQGSRAAVRNDRDRLRGRRPCARRHGHLARTGARTRAHPRLPCARHLRAIYFAALYLAPAAEASLIASLWALFTVVFSGLLPNQPLRRRHLLAALIGLGAATLLVWNSLGDVAAGPQRALGLALAFGCALIWSSYSVASRLFAAVPSDSIAIPCLITAVLAALASRTFETWVSPADGLAWLALIGLGVGPVGAAFLLWDIGMKGGDVSLLGVLSYAAPILSTGLLVLLGLAAPSIQLGLACALMVLATAIAARSS